MLTRRSIGEDELTQRNSFMRTHSIPLNSSYEEDYDDEEYDDEEYDDEDED